MTERARAFIQRLWTRQAEKERLPSGIRQEAPGWKLLKNNFPENHSLRAKLKKTMGDGDLEKLLRGGETREMVFADFMRI